eukprot:4048293-Prymnesium_polylepis.1
MDTQPDDRAHRHTSVPADVLPARNGVGLSGHWGSLPRAHVHKQRKGSDAHRAIFAPPLRVHPAIDARDGNRICGRPADKRVVSVASEHLHLHHRGDRTGTVGLHVELEHLRRHGPHIGEPREADTEWFCGYMLCDVPLCAKHTVPSSSKRFVTMAPGESVCAGRNDTSRSRGHDAIPI